MKLSTQLVVIFIFFSLLILSIIGFVSFTISSDMINQKTENHLRSIVTLKTNQLNNLLFEELEDLELLVNQEKFVKSYQVMMEEHKNNIQHSPTHSDIKQIIIEYYQLQNDDLVELFIVTPKGVVHISSDNSQEGKIKFEEKYFIEGLKGPYIQPFYYDSALRTLALTLSVPIVDNDNNTLGVLVGRLNIDKIAEIMNENSGLGKTGKTFLVTNYNYLVSLSDESNSLSKRVNSGSITNCLKGNSGLEQYKNYEDKLVIGRYVWLNKLSSCIFAEIDFAEAYSSTKKLSNLIMFIGIFIAILSIIIALLVSKAISKPIIKLSYELDQISKGDFKVKLEPSLITEIQQLINSFNRILVSLKLAVKKVGITKEEIGIGEALEAKKRAERLAKKRTEQLERFVELAVGRERKMIEMKKISLGHNKFKLRKKNLKEKLNKYLEKEKLKQGNGNRQSK